MGGCQALRDKVGDPDIVLYFSIEIPGNLRYGIGLVPGKIQPEPET
jgi:hypothetical protein